MHLSSLKADHKNYATSDPLLHAPVTEILSSHPNPICEKSYKPQLLGLFIQSCIQPLRDPL